MASAPLIGVTTSITTVRPDPTGRSDPPGRAPERAFVNTAYLAAVEQAGGVPVLLPPALTPTALDALWRRIDGLLLTGGGDIDPARFGEAPHPSVADIAPARDALELDLVLRALDEGRPLLAICRGIQVLDVALGGTLYQDVPSDPRPALVHSQRGPREQPTHRVKVEEGTPLAAVLGALEVEVNSFHHQALKGLGRGLRAVAWAPDGIVEGVDMPAAKSLVLGVQWHPEDLVGHDSAARRLFAALVREAGAAATRR